jgi:VWFA-related protein
MAGAAAAQQNGAVIRVDVREVLVPVIVTDSKGHHVTGLQREDFRVEEDGVEQTITAFSTDSSPSAELLSALIERPAEAPPAAASKPLPHTFVICIDTLHTGFGNSARIGEALERLLEKEKPGGAQYSVVAVGRQLRVLATAAADPAAVAARIKGLQGGLGGTEAAALAAEASDLKNSMYDFCRRCAACGAGATRATCESEVQNLKQSLDAQADRWGQIRRQMLEQLQAVVEELAKLPTGRTLVFVSDGFSLQPARDFYAVASAFLPAAPQFKGPGPIDLQPELQKVIRAAVKGNVRIYAVDSRGVAQSTLSAAGSMDAAAPLDRSAPSVIRRVPSSSRGGGLMSAMDHEASALEFQKSSGMEQLASSTGGVFFHQSNDLRKELQSVLADGREYYLVAYVPSNAAQDGSFRGIRVEVKGKKLQVRAKAGYWAPGISPIVR